MRKISTKFMATLFLLSASGAAFAHPGHNLSDFAAGLAHPFLGFDLLLAMVAVGLWAAQSGGKKIWLLPTTFMTALVIGANIAKQWTTLPLIESGIAASVMSLGLLVALSARLPAPSRVVLTALFGLFHGYAHGLELPESAAPVGFALGFLLATATLHLSGITMSVFTRQRHGAITKMLGAGIAVSGAYLLVNI